MTNLTLALDAMGGELGPQAVVPALQQALVHFPQIKFLIIGDEQQLVPLLSRYKIDTHPNLTLIHASQVVRMKDSPIYALRQLKQSSMRIALDCVADGRADACVSCGNTGALMAIAKIVLKTLPGIDRPALIGTLPTINGGLVHMLDLGANVQCDSHTLFQFAAMGSTAVEVAYNRQKPKVALLNVGIEEIKGNDQVQQAATMLKGTNAINYYGFVEGHDIFLGNVDVIVCDGFVGNITLKSTEGIARLMSSHIQETLFKGFWGKCLSKFMAPLLKSSMKRMNPDHYNGASLIGLRGVVVKSHGSANAKAVFQAIKTAAVEAGQALPSKINGTIESLLLDNNYN